MEKYRVGLEFSEKNLQLAVVGRRKQAWQLLETCAVDVSHNKQQLLQEIRRSQARSIRHTILSLPSPQVLMKEIRLDATLSADEIYQHLHQQAATLFGKPADHWYFDCEPHFSTSITQQACFRVAAAPRETILAAVKLCHELGLRVRTVTVDTLALARLAPTLQNYQPDQAQAILWLKSNELLFIVTLSGQLIFSKTTTVHATQSISDILIPLIHFFNGLYPQTILERIFLLNNDPLVIEGLIIENAALNTNVWQIPHAIQAEEFCSLGLAIYDN